MTYCQGGRKRGRLDKVGGTSVEDVSLLFQETMTKKITKTKRMPKTKKIYKDRAKDKDKKTLFKI